MTLAIALLLIFLLVGWYFRSWKIPVLCLLPALFGGGLAIAVLYFGKGTLSPIVWYFGPVIPGVSVIYPLCLINHFLKKGNMKVGLQEMTLTIFLCSLASAGVFLCLVFLQSYELRDFGWFAAISVCGSAFFTLVILPRFLTEKDRNAGRTTKTLVDRISCFPFERKKWIILVLISAGVASLFFLPVARFDFITHDFDLLVKLSMIFVALLLVISFGRFEMGLTASLPMFFGWMLTLGLMGLTGIKFHILNIVVISFIFGLGANYSILMMRGHLYEYKYGTSENSSYKSSIILSAAIILFSFGALLFHPNPTLKPIALIPVFGITCVVLITFTIQPLFVNWFLLDRMKKGRYPVTLRIFIKTLITWGNIVLLAIIHVILGGLIFLLLPIPRKKKQQLFHQLFCALCKTYIFVTFPTNRKLYNPHHEDFSKPAVIISNHQSLIETPAFLQLHPKIIMLTNDWVWNSPVFGPVARMASYFNASHGIDGILDKLKEKVDEGYSIMIFPEGHRYSDNQVHRFHRGAFYLAEKLQLDLLPVVVFGSGEFLGKGEFWGRPTGLRMKILKRIVPGDTCMGTGYSERSKLFRKYYRKEYNDFMAEEATGFYYRKKLVLNYIFKGPVLEWYLRVKLGIEKNYQRYNELIPRDAEILDLGCGYGFMAYMLNMNAPGRRITGVDYDEEKIRVAGNAVFRNRSLDFICADISEMDFDNKDVILLSDVLHYFPPEKQEKILIRCMNKVNPGGMIIIRDADSTEEIKHRRTKLTEFLSTRFTGFNKVAGDSGLHFTSLGTITAIFKNNGLVPEIIREEKLTSNILMVIRK